MPLGISVDYRIADYLIVQPLLQNVKMPVGPLNTAAAAAAAATDTYSSTKLRLGDGGYHSMGAFLLRFYGFSRPQYVSTRSARERIGSTSGQCAAKEGQGAKGRSQARSGLLLSCKLSR